MNNKINPHYICALGRPNDWFQSGRPIMVRDILFCLAWDKNDHFDHDAWVLGVRCRLLGVGVGCWASDVGCWVLGAGYNEAEAQG